MFKYGMLGHLSPNPNTFLFIHFSFLFISSELYTTDDHLNVKNYDLIYPQQKIK